MPPSGCSVQEATRPRSSGKGPRNQTGPGRPSAEQRRLVVQAMARRYAKTPATELRADNLARLQLQADVLRTLRGDSGLTLRSALQGPPLSAKDAPVQDGAGTQAAEKGDEADTHLVGGEVAAPTDLADPPYPPAAPPLAESPPPAPADVPLPEPSDEGPPRDSGTGHPPSPVKGVDLPPAKEKLVLSLLDRIAARKQQIATPVKNRRPGKATSPAKAKPADTSVPPMAVPPDVPPTPMEGAEPLTQVLVPEARPISPEPLSGTTVLLEEFVVPAPRAPTPTSASTVTSVGSDAGRGDGVPAPLLRTFSRRPIAPTAVVPLGDAVDPCGTGGPLSPESSNPEPISADSNGVMVSAGMDDETQPFPTGCEVSPIELELGLAGPDDSQEDSRPKRCKLLASVELGKDGSRRVKPDPPRPPVDWDQLSDESREERGDVGEDDESDAQGSDEAEEVEEEDEDEEDEEGEKRSVHESTPAAGPPPPSGEGVLDADEREGLQNSQLMLLRWEMSQSQFEEMDSQSPSQYQFEEEEDTDALAPTASLSPHDLSLSQLSQPASLTRTASSLKRRPSFLGLVRAGDALQREKLESIKRQNSYSNTSCAAIVYSEDPVTPNSSGSIGVPKRRIQPVPRPQEEPLFVALSSAPRAGTKRKHPSSQPNDGGAGDVKRPKA